MVVGVLVAAVGVLVMVGAFGDWVYRYSYCLVYSLIGVLFAVGVVTVTDVLAVSVLVAVGVLATVGVAVSKRARVCMRVCIHVCVCVCVILYWRKFGTLHRPL